MTTNAAWTVVFEDKTVMKHSGDGAGAMYVIDDDAFWATTAFQNIWAIQKGAANVNDEVEHRDSTPHNSLATEGLDFQQFINKWDEAHLLQLQTDWDESNHLVEDPVGSETMRDETTDEKIARLGPRPTSYSS
jgi:hypothetical protein